MTESVPTGASTSCSIHYLDFSSVERINSWAALNQDKQLISIETVRRNLHGETVSGLDKFRVWYRLTTVSESAPGNLSE